MLKTSRFTERIAVFRKEKQTDSNGDLINAFISIGEFYACFKFLSGSETIKSGVIAKNTVSIRLRWDKKAEKITANCIAKWNDKAINIISVLPDMETRHYIDLVGEIGVINDANLMG